MKKNSHPSGEVAEALGQAMAAEMIASLEPEKAAQVILPKRDLLEREDRQAQRRARDEEDKRRDEQRRARARGRPLQPPADLVRRVLRGQDQGPRRARRAVPADRGDRPRRPRPRPSTRSRSAAAEPEAPVTPATATVEPEAQVEGEGGPRRPPTRPTETGSAPQPDDDGDAAAYPLGRCRSAPAWR